MDKKIKLLKRLKGLSLSKGRLNKLIMEKLKNPIIYNREEKEIKKLKKDWYDLVGTTCIWESLYGVILEVKGSPNWKRKGGRSSRYYKVKGEGGNRSTPYILGLKSKRGSYSLKLKSLTYVTIKGEYQMKKK